MNLDNFSEILRPSPQFGAVLRVWIKRESGLFLFQPGQHSVPGWSQHLPPWGGLLFVWNIHHRNLHFVEHNLNLHAHNGKACIVWDFHKNSACIREKQFAVFSQVAQISTLIKSSSVPVTNRFWVRCLFEWDACFKSSLSLKRTNQQEVSNPTQNWFSERYFWTFPWIFSLLSKGRTKVLSQKNPQKNLGFFFVDVSYHPWKDLDTQPCPSEIFLSSWQQQTSKVLFPCMTHEGRNSPKFSMCRDLGQKSFYSSQSSQKKPEVDLYKWKNSKIDQHVNGHQGRTLPADPWAQEIALRASLDQIRKRETQSPVQLSF